MMTMLDARGLACPLPLTLARRRLAELAPGESLRYRFRAERARAAT